MIEEDIRPGDHVHEISTHKTYRVESLGEEVTLVHPYFKDVVKTVLRAVFDAEVTLGGDVFRVFGKCLRK